MPSYDFIYDLLEKLESQGFEYMLTFNLPSESEEVECTMQSNMQQEDIVKMLEVIKNKLEEGKKPKYRDYKKRKRNERKKPPKKDGEQ
jgi:secreted Zn-dependent insulinase-like peptidase